MRLRISPQPFPSRSSATCWACHATSADRCAAGRSRSSARWSPCSTPSSRQTASAACATSWTYLATLVAERRRRPGSDDDLLTRLIRDETGGQPLSEPELLHNCIFLLNARPRDDDEPDRQRARAAGRTPGRGRAAARAAGAHPDAVSRSACATRARTSSATGSSSSRSRSAACASSPARISRCASARRIAILLRFRRPIASTSPARPTRTWPSPPARTRALACPSRGSRRALRCCERCSVFRRLRLAGARCPRATRALSRLADAAHRVRVTSAVSSSAVCRRRVWLCRVTARWRRDRARRRGPRRRSGS